MKKVFLAFCLLAVLTGCSTNKGGDAITVVDRVDMDRFMGKWYVVSTVPNVFDRKPHNATVQFSRADRGIRLEYAFNSGDYNGKEKLIKCKVMVDNPGINSDWQITWPWPFARDLRVVYFEPDYSAAVLASPNKKDAWIIARSPNVDPPLFSDMILYLQQFGFDVGKMRRVPHG